VRFVLVHGAWHDRRCWDALTDALDQRGCVASAVDLPAEDPDAGIEDCAAVVRAGIDEEGDPADTVVVAHSFGGLILPVAAAGRPLAGIVYVAAFVPEPGKSFGDQVRAEPDMFASTWRPLADQQVAHDDGSTWWPADVAVEAFYHDCAPSVAATAAAGLRPQQWKISGEPCPLAELPDLPTRYIACSEDRSINISWAIRTARERLGVEAEVMESSHSPMLSRPGELADRLLE
jgi:pimeloyl-ACP methyl ester carboxylesterase